jgi:hypothetical protein
MSPFRLLSLAAVAALATPSLVSTVDAFVAVPCLSPGRQSCNLFSPFPALHVSSTARDDDAFSAFADSLEDGSTQSTKKSTNRSSSSGSSSFSSSSSTSAAIPKEQQSWQAAIDELLDPTTPLSRRQALLGKLAKSNQDIQESVIAALRDRKVRLFLCWKYHRGCTLLVCNR